MMDERMEFPIQTSNRAEAATSPAIGAGPFSPEGILYVQFASIEAFGNAYAYEITSAEHWLRIYIKKFKLTLKYELRFSIGG